MCGRYAASANPDELIEAFEVEIDGTGEPTRSVLANPQDPPAGTPDYNMAPSKQAPVVLQRRPRGGRGAAGEEQSEPAATAQEPVRQLRLLSWGLVPSWAKDPGIGMRMINARTESLLDKGAFAKPARSRRCLVPARGWYEWQASPVTTDRRGKPRKQPFFVARADEELLAFAGLYEFWRDPAAEPGSSEAWLTTFTILTGPAEPGLDRIHDRQPVVLDRDRWADWLDPELQDESAVQALLSDHRPGRFTAWPVRPEVNATRNNGPRLIEPVPVEELDGTVDPTTGEIVGGNPA
ncbi:SOS response-associated peptidase [Ornithinicoccus halotolerans]|uniref:SOS response-associated peptidase n=1 Tax=Ornithinicoccus halotolerans TaxID=1748220 RepID=UPI001294A4F6|nr:SOS response-associated peptidase [Ornithinicoccus halotolerans]